jgi:PAS domain S-box-containing protein
MLDPQADAAVLLRMMLENLPCGVSVYDAQWRLVAHNRQFRVLMGYPDSLFEGPALHFQDLLRYNAQSGEYGPGDAQAQIAAMVQRALDPRGHRFERTRPNGVTLEIQGAPMPGGGFVTTYTDITESKKSQAALRESEERLHRAMEGSGLALWDFDVASGQVYLSDAWSRMLGGPPEPTVTTFDALAARVPEEDQPAVLAVMVPLMKGEIPVYSVEHRVRRADGSLAWIQSEGRIAERDAQGRVTRAVGTNKDITESRGVREALSQTSSLLKSVLDAATGMLVLGVGLHGRVTVFNRGAERLLGYSAAEVIDRTGPLIFFDPVQVQARSNELAARLGRPLRAGEVFAHESVRGTPREWICVRKDGGRFVLSMEITAIRGGDGRLLGHVGTGHDVTQRLEHERSLREARAAAEQAAQAKAAFLATMSHEIRTPMNGVIGMTSLLLDTPLSEQQREFTEVIRQSGEGLLVVINDILDYSKIESGHMALEWLPFDLQEALESSIDILALKAREKRLDLVYLVEPDVPPWIHGDMSRLRQVLVNLISNALKFTQHGEVFVSVRRLQDVTGAQVMLEFCVKDTGIGIAPDKLSRLFQPFSQVDSSISRRYGGTGLGLAISSRLVQAMGGRIWAESTPGAGAQFCFTLSTAPAQAVTQPGKLGLSELRGRRVLLVDDNPTNLRIQGLQAARWGMAHQAASSATQALELLAGGDVFDVVITDMHMPGMDGLGFARRLRTLYPGLPVVLLSSVNLREPAEAALFSAVLMKPARQLMLFEALVRVMPQDGRAAAVPAAPRVSQFDPGMAARVPLRILLAEDNEVNQKVAQHVLKGFGYQADVAANGIEVLEALQRRAYDLILMDVQMPEMDGLQATRAIVRNWPEGARPRIVAMSANAMREDTDEAIAAGMDDYIVKPISVPVLRAVLQTCGAKRADRAAGG